MSEMNPSENKPLISVLMPVYNGREFLAEAIASILVQSEADFEFLIIDDGSTDGSAAVIDAAAARDKRIRVIRRENRGLIASLNEGLELARGTFIARMDADDLALPNRFAAQIALMTSEAADLCGCHYLIINRMGKVLSCSIQPTTREMFPLWLCCGTPFAHGSVMIRTAFLRRHELTYGTEGFKADEDYALWTTCYGLGGKFTNVDEVLFKYRAYQGSFSKTKIDRMTAQHHQIAQLFIRKHKADIQNAFSAVLADPHLSLSEKQFLAKASVEVTFQSPSTIVLKVLQHFGLVVALPHVLAQILLILRARLAARKLQELSIEGKIGR